MKADRPYDVLYHNTYMNRKIKNDRSALSWGGFDLINPVHVCVYVGITPIPINLMIWTKVSARGDSVTAALLDG